MLDWGQAHSQTWLTNQKEKSHLEQAWKQVCLWHYETRVNGSEATCTVSFTLALSSSKGLRNSSQMESSRPSTQEQMLDHSAAHCTVSSVASATGWEKKEDVRINVPGLFVLREFVAHGGDCVWYYLSQ